MGMFQKVGEWLTDKSDRFVRGSNANHAGSYYASDVADRAYGKRREEAAEASEDADHSSIDPFGRDPNDEYGGRVPYRSQRDAQAEAEQAREQQRRMEETMRRQAARPQAAAPSYATQPFQAVANPSFMANPANPNAQASNVVPFPGMMQNPNGNVYAHVEYIVLLCSRNECTKVIEYIKSTASVFLNMEFIANDSERQRCVDMLSGAAYTLGCQLTKISARGIYLISSPAVQVVVDPKLRKYTATPEAQGFVRQNYDYGKGGENAYAYGDYAQRPPMAHRAMQQPAPQAQPAPQQPPAQRPSFSAASPTSSFAAQPRRMNQPFGTQGTFGGAEAYQNNQSFANGQTGRYTAEYKG